MPGPFGGPRLRDLVDFRSALREREGDPFLYHVTEQSLVDDIRASGLSPGMTKTEERKTGFAEAVESGEPFPVEHTPPGVQARRELDELLRDARRFLDVDLPRHDDAVFFWTQFSEAMSAARNVTGNHVIVVVDPRDLPPSCQGAVGDSVLLEQLFNDVKFSYMGQAPVNDERWFEEAKTFWRTAERYTGQTGRNIEVWFDCTVPPTAISDIVDIKF